MPNLPAFAAQHHPKRLLLLGGILALLAALGLGGVLIWRTGSPKSTPYDVVVVGAGPGGVAAGIQAARMGENVALLEPTDWIGGQMAAAGVGSMDEGSPAARQGGLYADFLGRVTAFYKAQHKSVGTCYYSASTVCVDPQVGRAILGQMLQSESQNLHVFTRTTVTAVTKQGNTVTGVVAGNKRFSGKVVIDADEYGDVLAMAGAAYRLGNGTSANPRPSCVQSTTYTAVIKQYPHGPPAGLLFKRPPPGYTPAVAAHFATFLKQQGYGLVVKSNSTQAHNRLPMAFPAYAAYRGYPDLANPANYNALQQNGHSITRTSLNLGNDFPLQGTLSSAYISNPVYRKQADCQAKLLTLQLTYYIQHDLGEHDWSIANDEGYNTPYSQAQHCAILNGYKGFEQNMSQEAYVREGRRLVGVETLTGNGLVASWANKKTYTTYPDSIAVGYYSMDLHLCNTPDTLEPAFDTAADAQRGGPFEVPLGTLIPEQVNGLLAAEKNISVSRLAGGAIREQPIAMATGQAAGALAALAVRTHTQPRYVPAASVQAALHAAHAVTAIPRVHG